jgi:hypothetical protein
VDKPEGDKSKSPIEQFSAIEPSPLPPLALDGGFAAGPIGAPPPIPPATPATFVCLRGPCRHYWELVSHMESGNPKETWGEGGLVDADGHALEQPRAVSRTCVANPGYETDLTDDNVYACNRWDPLSPREVKRLEKRRSKYLKLHPDHR